MCNNNIFGLFVQTVNQLPIICQQSQRLRLKLTKYILLHSTRNEEETSAIW